MSQFDGNKKLGLIVCLMLGGGALFSSTSPTKSAVPAETQSVAPTTDGVSAVAPAAPAIPATALEGRWAGTFAYNKNRADADILREVDTPATLHLVHESDGVFTGVIMTHAKRPPMGSAKFSMKPDGAGGYILRSDRMGGTSWQLLVRLKPSSADEMSGQWGDENYSDDLPAKGSVTFKRVALKDPFPPKLSGVLKGTYTYFTSNDVTKHNLTITIREEVSEDTYQGTIKGEQYVNGSFGGIYDPKTGTFLIKGERNFNITLFRTDGGWNGVLDYGSDEGGPLQFTP